MKKGAAVEVVMKALSCFDLQNLTRKWLGQNIRQIHPNHHKILIFLVVLS
jgi:hypothetical protein